MCSQIHQAARAKSQDKHESIGLTGETVVAPAPIEMW